MIKYEIKGEDLPVLICYPENGQTIITERGSMSWMSPNMVMETKGGGVGKMFGRAFSGESMFLNQYTACGGDGMIAFSSSFPGSIIAFNITPDSGIVIQKGGFLAMEQGLDLSLFFQRRFGAGLVGGEGFIMQKVSGNGMVFVEVDGACIEYNLSSGQQIVVGTGHVAAMSDTCKMDIQTVKGVKNAIFGGEGLFNTVITGPGKVYLQTMPIYNVANAIRPYIPTGN